MHPSDTESFSRMFWLVENVLGLVVGSNPARVGSDEGRAHPQPHFALGLSDRVDAVTPCHLGVN